MELNTTDIVIIFYTVIHILIFFYQKSKLDILDRFVKIFDLKKLEDYVEIERKLANSKAIEMIINSDELKNTIKNINNESYENITIEMVAVITRFLEVSNEDERNNFIENNLPNSKHLFKEFYS